MISATARIDQNDLNRLRKTMYSLGKKYENLAERTPTELAIAGMYYAKGVAPYYTGTAIRSIAYKSDGGNTSEIFIDNNILKNEGSNADRIRLGKEPFNYVLHMHRNNGAMGRGVKIKSGDPRFMFSTREYVKRKLQEKISVSLGGKY